ncbi:MAG: DNA repair protein RecO [Deltaproteobacteria bacterium]|jgi:DNA repair protein RecO (recombination protein O)|nr:DNA repair protein RecO [Deltaproteobacteria bacterium]
MTGNGPPEGPSGGPAKELSKGGRRAAAKAPKGSGAPSRPALPAAARLPAIVLARSLKSEHDIMATLITREKGLVSALAKNARQSVRRFGGGLLSPGAAAWYYLKRRPGSPVWFLEKAEANDKAPVLPSDPLARALASWALELVRAFEARDNPAPETFNLLLRHLADLSKLTDFSPPALDARSRSVAFCKLYLELAGFGPDLASCRSCGSSRAPYFRLDPLARGLICPKCGGFGINRQGALSKAAAASLASVQSCARPPSLSEEETRAAEGFFRKLATLEAGRSFKSPKVAEQLLSEAKKEDGQAAEANEAEEPGEAGAERADSNEADSQARRPF